MLRSHAVPSNTGTHATWKKKSTQYDGVLKSKYMVPSIRTPVALKRAIQIETTKQTKTAANSSVTTSLRKSLNSHAAYLAV